MRKFLNRFISVRGAVLLFAALLSTHNAKGIPPVVNNGYILNATGTSATFKGNVTHPGSGQVVHHVEHTLTAKRYPNLKLWLDANETAEMDKGSFSGSEGVPANNDTIGYWGDRSGNGNFATPYQAASNREPKYLSVGMNGKPTVQFDGSNDCLLINNSTSSFDAWDKMTVFLVAEIYDTSNSRRYLGKGSTAGGWSLAGSSASQMRYKIMGTTGGDEQSANITRNAQHLITLTFGNGSREFFSFGEQKSTNSDSGTISLVPNASLGVGCTVNDSGSPTSNAKISISELLIYNDKLSSEARQRVEGYLAHKWDKASSLVAGHPYKTNQPTFSDSADGVELTLFWGDEDGGENSSAWDNQVPLGVHLKAQTTNGFMGYGFPGGVNGTPTPNDSFFNDIETLRALPPAGANLTQGEPNDPAGNGFYFNGDNDFKNAGIGINQYDNYMDLWLADFNPQETGIYRFKMDQKDDRVTIWLDLDQDGVFSTTGSAGNEKMGGNSNFTSANLPLTAGQTYKIALAHCAYGGGSRFRAWFQTPSAGMTVIKPLDSAQNGIFTTLALSNGQPLSTQLPLEANVTGLNPGGTYYYRIRGVNSDGTDWADSSGAFVSENVLEINAGTLSFNTDGPNPTWTSSNGRGGNGQIVTNTYTDDLGDTFSYTVAKYDFERVSIGSSVTVDLNGSNPLFLNVDGNASILAVLDANGTDGSNVKVNGNQAGRLGGGYGGHDWNGSTVGPGGNPSHLYAGLFNSGGAPFKGWSDLSSTTLLAGQEPGGGSYGGVGGRPEPVGGEGNFTTISPSGKTYGDDNLTHLFAGSGGGGGNERQGGSGGGAIKIVAGGILTIGADIWACGGRGGARWHEARRSGGAGSGGAIYLKGTSVIISSGVSISANGGLPASHTNGIITAGNTFARDGGGSGVACGGGGRVYLEATASLVNNTSPINNNLTAAGGTGTGRPGTNGTVKIVRPQVSELIFSSGSLFVDTDSAAITHTDGSFLQGSLEDHNFTDSNGTIYPYRVAVFTADQINLGSSVVVSLQGSNALSLRTRNNGNLTISTNLIADGSDATEPTSNNGLGGVAGLGGWAGGNKNDHGKGPGGGRERGAGNNRGGGGGYGNLGWDDLNSHTDHGNPYGDPRITHLLGGSGGGGGNWHGGGSGGGAIELVAHGLGNLLISAGAKISANGGDTNDANRGGGAGSGGSIRLTGGTITNNGTLEATGIAPTAVGDGSGGRIAFESNGTVITGNVNVKGRYPWGATDGQAEGTVAVLGNTSGSGSLSYNSGTLVIDTTAAYWRHTNGKHGEGTITEHNDSGIVYRTCTFTFDEINLQSGLTVELKGDNALILKTRNNGNATIGVNLNADGEDQTYDNTRTPGNHHNLGFGKLGGRMGSWPGSSAASLGKGSGGGGARVFNNQKGGGGGYGSPGEHSDGTLGKIYGSPSLVHLHGGSSGGGGEWMGGGAGGGALAIEADGNGTLTILSGVTISANGGSGKNLSDPNFVIARPGGGGSGGSLRFAGGSIINHGTISAKGGSEHDYPVGGGGRVAFFFQQGLNFGVVDAGNAAFAGTIHNMLNHPPADLNFTIPLTIAENRPTGTVLGQFTANDTDANATVTYSLVDGNGLNNNALFSLDANGTLRNAAAFDFESHGSSLAIRVRATDERNASVDKTFAVALLDENEAPINLASPAPLTIAENQPIGTVVGEFNASDPDANATLSYYLVSGTGATNNSLFTLEANGTLKTATTFDYERYASNYSIRVQVKDVHNTSIDKTFLVSVTDTHVPLVRTVSHLTRQSFNHRFNRGNSHYLFTGEILANGGSPVLQAGIEISKRLAFSNSSKLTANPTLENPIFSAVAYALESDQRYYYRAYATNAEGTTYGSPKRFTTSPAQQTWWTQMPSVSGGWRNSDWLGTFRRHENSEWIYHAKLRWAYALPDDEKGLWLWKREMGWLWTDKEIYPFLYHNAQGGWLYFYGQRKGTLLFYDYEAKRWISQEDRQ